MLHITNGDLAADAIRTAGLTGGVLPWRDVLHEGPVPAPGTLDALRPLRARFLAGQGWGQAVDIAASLEVRDRALAASAVDDEVVLWFEHDLYDQLQLAQVLDWFSSGARPVRLSIVQANDYLGPMAPERVAALFADRRDVTPGQLEAAQAAWRAFTSPDPRDIERVLPETAPLEFMGAALRRHLEEFPSTVNGLSRTEQQTLEALRDGPMPLENLYKAAHHRREAAVFLGDAVFVALLAPLTRGDDALVRVDGDIASGPSLAPAALTDAGRQVLAGRADRVALLGIDRWLGGVHLRGRRVDWRRDPDSRRIVYLEEG